MVLYWMDVHGESMTPPQFQFERISSYRDTFTRQISEAILIETEGNLNKRHEYGSNFLYRLESSKSEWEKNKLIEKEIKKKANLNSDLLNFTNVIKDVLKKCNKSKDTVPNANSAGSNCRYKLVNKRKIMEEDYLLGTVMEKKMRAEETSTPKRNFGPYRMIKPELSPIDKSPIYDLSTSIDSLGSSFGIERQPAPVLRAGLSPQLRRLLSKPCGEEDDIQGLLKATIDLTRAAIARGIITGPNLGREVDEVSIKLENNAFSKHSGGFEIEPLSQMMEKISLDGWTNAMMWDNLNISEDRHTRRKGILTWDLERVNVYKDLFAGSYILKPTCGNRVNRSTDGGMKTPDVCGTLLMKEATGGEVKIINKKRRYSPTSDTQLGTLSKHSTKIKKSPGQREKFNKLFFKKGLESTDLSGSPNLRPVKRSTVTPRRRLVPGQKLITSSFSPRNKDVVKDASID